MDALRWEFLGPALKNVTLFCFAHSISIVFCPGPWFTILSKKRTYTALKPVFQFISSTEDYLQTDWLGMVKYWLFCTVRSENSRPRWEMCPKTKELRKNYASNASLRECLPCQPPSWFTHILQWNIVRQCWNSEIDCNI